MRSELTLFEDDRRPPARPIHEASRSNRSRGRRLKVVDVAVRDADHRRGTREYIGAKHGFARASGAYEHHAVLPGHSERHGGGLHELPVRPWPLRRGGPEARLRGLEQTLRRIGPDVVLLHGTDYETREVARLSEEVGARVVDVGGDGNAPSLPLRRGLHPAFHPGRDAARRRHVLYAGSLEPEKGIELLLGATALANGEWSLRIVGAGPESEALRRRARSLGLAGQVGFLPYVRDRERLARMFAEASCVVVPGAAETFGLVALEAAACAAPVVCCENAPVAAVLGDLAETFEPGDVEGLESAIRSARSRPSDRVAAAGLVAAHSWDRVLADELRDIDALVS
jgi:glycosyltransferase involved in cell wall biosynthesis